MEIITKYVAFDGMEFDNEEDCANYEFETKAKECIEYFTLYDRNRKPIKFCVDDEVLADVFYIVIKDEKAFLFLDDWMTDCGYYSTIGKSAYNQNIKNYVGLWMWDEQEEDWKHWETEMSKMRELGEYFQRFEE